MSEAPHDPIRRHTKGNVRIKQYLLQSTTTNKMGILHPYLHHAPISLWMGSTFSRGIFLIKENFVYPNDPSKSFL